MGTDPLALAEPSAGKAVGVVGTTPIEPDGTWQQRDRWLTVAAVGGAVLVGAVVAAAKGADPYRGFLGVAYLAVLALLAVGDVRTRRAPNRVVYPALAVAVAASLLLGQAGAIEALLGAGAAFLVMLVVALLGRGAMGYGDVKVGTLCGLAVGLHGVVPLLVITALSSAAVAGVLLALRIRKRTDSLPFVPFLGGATVMAMTFYPLYLWG